MGRPWQDQGFWVGRYLKGYRGREVVQDSPAGYRSGRTNFRKAPAHSVGGHWCWGEGLLIAVKFGLLESV